MIPFIAEIIVFLFCLFFIGVVITIPILIIVLLVKAIKKTDSGGNDSKKSPYHNYENDI